jgi:putative spermidine/putrescine transport system permease protein
MTSRAESGGGALPVAALRLWPRPARYYRSVGAWWILPAALFLVVFFVLPLVENIEKSIALSELLRPGAEQSYYTKLFTDPFYLWVTAQTVILSVGVTLICVVIGYPIALYLVRHAGRWSGVAIFLLIAPLLTSIIMRTFGWRVLFARRGLFNEALLGMGWVEQPLNFLNGPVPAVIGLVHVLVPFMVLSIASVLRNIDPGLEESARLLGASRLAAFREVTLPLSLDGIGTGAILVFLLANGSFVTLLLLAGGSIQTLPLLIYQQFNTTRDFGFAAAMSNVLLSVAIGCLYLQLRLIRRRGVKGA